MCDRHGCLASARAAGTCRTPEPSGTPKVEKARHCPGADQPPGAGEGVRRGLWACLHVQRMADESDALPQLSGRRGSDVRWVRGTEAGLWDGLALPLVRAGQPVSHLACATVGTGTTSTPHPVHRVIPGRRVVSLSQVPGPPGIQAKGSPNTSGCRRSVHPHVTRPRGSRSHPPLQRRRCLCCLIHAELGLDTPLVRDISVRTTVCPACVSTCSSPGIGGHEVRLAS